MSTRHHFGSNPETVTATATLTIAPLDDASTSIEVRVTLQRRDDSGWHMTLLESLAAHIQPGRMFRLMGIKNVDPPHLAGEGFNITGHTLADADQTLVDQRASERFYMQELGGL